MGLHKPGLISNQPWISLELMGPQPSWWSTGYLHILGKGKTVSSVGSHWEIHQTPEDRFKLMIVQMNWWNSGTLRKQTDEQQTQQWQSHEYGMGICRWEWDRALIRIALYVYEIVKEQTSSLFNNWYMHHAWSNNCYIHYVWSNNWYMHYVWSNNSHMHYVWMNPKDLTLVEDHQSLSFHTLWLAFIYSFYFIETMVMKWGIIIKSRQR